MDETNNILNVLVSNEESERNKTYTGLMNKIYQIIIDCSEVFNENCESDILKLQLDSFIIENFDEEQIWQQLNIFNKKFQDGIRSVLLNQEKFLQVFIEQIIETRELRDIPTNLSSKKRLLNKNSSLKNNKKITKDISFNKSLFSIDEMEKFIQNEELNNQKLNEEEFDEIMFKDIPMDSETESLKIYSGVTRKNSERFEPKEYSREEKNNLNEKNQENFEKDYELDTDDGNSVKDFDDSDSIDIKSKHQIYEIEYDKEIKRLEKENLSIKSWQYKGETDASSRPKDSLLNEFLVYDYSSVKAPIVTPQVTNDIEKIVKSRIRDKIWDDVEKKIKPTNDQNAFRLDAPIDGSKSQQGLGEIYANEYLSKINKSATSNENSKAHEEITELLEKIYKKLDVLYDFSFKPKERKAEVCVVSSNVPSMNNENEGPLAKSLTGQMAPQELFHPYQSEANPHLDSSLSLYKVKRQKRYFALKNKKSNGKNSVNPSKALKTKQSVKMEDQRTFRKNNNRFGSSKYFENLLKNPQENNLKMNKTKKI